MQPLLTVLIATYNRCPILERTLETLASQQLPESVSREILIVDNNSRDATRQVVEAFAAGVPFPVRYLFEPRQGKVFALNAGGLAAAGEIVVFTDDDCRLDPGWLAGFARAFGEHPDCVAAGGRLLPLYPDDCPEWIRRFGRHLTGPIPAYDYGDQTRPGDDTMLPFLGGNMAVRRAALLAAGLFNEKRNYVGGGVGRARGGEDTDLYRRLQAAGGPIYYCGAAVVRHPVERERCRLGAIANWQVAFGANYAPPPGDAAPTLFGVPRWICRRLLTSGAGIVLHTFNPERRLLAFLEFCRVWGMARECRRRIGDPAQGANAAAGRRT